MASAKGAAPPLAQVAVLHCSQAMRDEGLGREIETVLSAVAPSGQPERIMRPTLSVPRLYERPLPPRR